MMPGLRESLLHVAVPSLPDFTYDTCYHRFCCVWHLSTIVGATYKQASNNPLRAQSDVLCEFAGAAAVHDAGPARVSVSCERAVLARGPGHQRSVPTADRVCKP